MKPFASLVRAARLRAYTALLTVQTWPLEYYLAQMCFAYGLWLLGPWSVYGSAPAAYTVLSVVPEWLVGVIFTLHGFLYSRALDSKDVARCRDGAAITVLLWLAVGGALMATVPLSAVVVVYGAPVAASVWVYTRLTLIEEAR